MAELFVILQCFDAFVWVTGRASGPEKVCVCVKNISKSYERILMKFFGGVGYGPRTGPWPYPTPHCDFAGDLHPFPLFCPNYLPPNAFSVGHWTAI